MAVVTKVYVFDVSCAGIFELAKILNNLVSDRL